MTGVFVFFRDKRPAEVGQPADFTTQRLATIVVKPCQQKEARKAHHSSIAQELDEQWLRGAPSIHRPENIIDARPHAHLFPHSQHRFEGHSLTVITTREASSLKYAVVVQGLYMYTTAKPGDMCWIMQVIRLPSRNTSEVIQIRHPSMDICP